MSLSSMNIAGSGLLSQSAKLDVISNNLANATTDGFKRSQASFADTLTQALQVPGGTGSGVGIGFGTGVALSAVRPDFEQGPLNETGRELDLAISGDGFFVVTDATGASRFARAGNFSVNADGQLVLPSDQGGLPVEPGIVIPDDANTVTISPDGTVSVSRSGQDGTEVVGQLQAARFLNPEGLVQLGGNLFAESGASGAAEMGVFGEDGCGSLQQGALEGSNVEYANELIELISSQRAFQFNAQVIQASNERLRIVASLND